MISARPVGLAMSALVLVLESDGCDSLRFNYEFVLIVALLDGRRSAVSVQGGLRGGRQAVAHYGPIAIPPPSPARIRTASSSGNTKILPSPIRPVSPDRAEWTIASTVASTNASLTAISSFSLGSRRISISCPR